MSNDSIRAEFEAFMLYSRNSKGVKARAQLLTRSADAPEEYASEHVQRHWWTWQNARRPTPPTAAGDSLAALLEHNEVQVSLLSDGRVFAAVRPYDREPLWYFATGRTLDAALIEAARHELAACGTRRAIASPASARPPHGAIGESPT